MNAAMLFTLAALFVPLTLVLTRRWRVDLAALWMLTTLALAQLSGLDLLASENTPAAALLVLKGFSQPVVITLIGLFILTQALTANGMVQWLGLQLNRLGGGSPYRLVLLFSLSAALLSLLMNNVAVGALLLPGAMQVARRNGLPPSKLLLPIAFGSALGGMATYFTTSNIIFSNLLINASLPGLSFWDFLPTGGVLAVAGLAYLTIFSPRLLPNREPGPEQALARRSSAEVEGFYAIQERLWEGKILPKSPLSGQTLRQTRIGELLGLTIVAIWRGKQALFAPESSERLQADDILLIVGNEQRAHQLADWGVSMGRETGGSGLSRFDARLVEVLLAPHSVYEGKTVKTLNFRRKYGFTAVALLRRGRSYRTDVGEMPLEPGDSLLMIGSPLRLRDLRQNPDLLLLEAEPPAPNVPRKRAIGSAALLLGAAAASLLGLPASLAVLCAATLALTFGLLPLQEAYRAVEWQVIFFVAGMSAISQAMNFTGLSAMLARQAVEALGGMGPLGLEAGFFLLAALFTQVLGSQASAFVLGPVTIDAALHLGADPRALAMAAALGCSAAFLTPTSHPVNLLMMNPGNYRWSDFLRLGLGLFLVTFLLLLLAMQWFW